MAGLTVRIEPSTEAVPSHADEAPLRTKAAALAAAEQRRQRVGGIISDCATVAELAAQAAGGTCRLRAPRQHLR